MSGYLHEPNIDPVLLHIWGPLQIRWYSLLYVGGFVVARWILRRLAREDRFLFTPDDVEEFILWLLIGAVVGARIIYCFVYDPRALMANPLYLFQVYKGGLSFHGGLLGTIVAAMVFSRQKKIPFWNVADAMALATPTGLGMGRIGNFINGELFGRVSYVPWAMIFRQGGPEPRHPSQIYELFLEGVCLFCLVWFVKSKSTKDGRIALSFLIGYSLCRFIAECFREPDPQLGYLVFGLSMGQILSLIMFLISSAVAFYVVRRGNRAVPKAVKAKVKAKAK